MRSKLLFISLVLALVIPACAMNPTEAPKTFLEQVAYVEAGAQGAIQTLQDLTCTKYLTTGECAQPGRPLHPQTALQYLDTISTVRIALKASTTMPSGGGSCLPGTQPVQSPIQCLQVAQQLLGGVRTILINLQKGG